MSALVGLDIALAVGGLAVLAVLALRLWRQVRALGRTVSAAAARFGEAQAEMDAISRETASRRAQDVH